MHEKCHRETRAGSEDGEGAIESSQRGNSRFLACGGTLAMPSFSRGGGAGEQSDWLGGCRDGVVLPYLQLNPGGNPVTAKGMAPG